MRQSKLFGHLLQDDRGATAIEYGLILSLVAMGLIAVMLAVGGEVVELWTWIDTDTGAAIDGNTPAAD